MGKKNIRLGAEGIQNNKSSQEQQMPSFAVPENQKSDWSKIPDYFRGLKVDLKSAGDNPKFIEYLKDVHGDKYSPLNPEHKSQIREAYVRFERSERITKKYTSLFENRFGDLLKDTKINRKNKIEEKQEEKKTKQTFKYIPTDKDDSPRSFDGKNYSRLNVPGQGALPVEAGLASKVVESESVEPTIEVKEAEAVVEPVDYKTSIERYIRELAKNNPEQLRKLEKKLERVEKGEKQIKSKQDIIDKYTSEGGREGMEEKLDILRKANSLKRAIFSKPLLRMLSFAHSEMLAYEKAQKEYGLADREKINQEIKKVKADIKTIKEAEKGKAKIKFEYSVMRSQVYFDNDLAKKIFEESQALLDKKISSLKDFESLKDLKEGKKFAEQLKAAFDKEISSKGKLQPGFENVPVSMSAKEFSDLEEFLDRSIEEKLEDRLSKALQKTETNAIDQVISKHLKQTQFAGKTPKESINAVYQTFIKLMNNMKLETEKKIQLSFSLNKYKYLTV